MNKALFWDILLTFAAKSEKEMNYTTYLFDFDYTLANSSKGIVLCFQHVLQRNGYIAVSDEAIKRDRKLLFGTD